MVLSFHFKAHGQYAQEYPCAILDLNLNCLQNQIASKITHIYLNSNILFISLENPEAKNQPTGVSSSKITSIEVLIKIAEILDVDVRELLVGTK